MFIWRRPVSMNRRMTSLACVSLMSVAFAACGSAPSPTAATTTSPSTALSSYAPVPTGQWWAVGGVTMCGPPVTIWIAGQQQQQLGSCAGILGDSAWPVTIHVGEQLGIHFTSDSSPWPWPPPSPSAAGVAELVSVADNGQTFVFQATNPGTATLSARGLRCPVSEQIYPSMVPCSFVALTVVP
jgi:hypothetical protein